MESFQVTDEALNIMGKSLFCDSLFFLPKSATVILMLQILAAIDEIRKFN